MPQTTHFSAWLMMLALAAWLAGCASVPHPDESELAPPLPPMAYDPADAHDSRAQPLDAGALGRAARL